MKPLALFAPVCLAAVLTLAGCGPGQKDGRQPPPASGINVDTASKAEPVASQAWPEPRYQGKTMTSWLNDLRDRDHDTRWRAKEAVVAIGEPAAAEVGKILRDDDGGVINTAMAVLAEMGKAAKGAAADIRSLRGRTKSAQVRDWCDKLLEEIGD